MRQSAGHHLVSDDTHDTGVAGTVAHCPDMRELLHW